MYNKPGFDEEERNNWREAKVLGFDSLFRFEIFATTRTTTERCVVPRFSERAQHELFGLAIVGRFTKAEVHVNGYLAI